MGASVWPRFGNISVIYISPGGFIWIRIEDILLYGVIRIRGLVTLTFSLLLRTRKFI